MLEEPTIHFNVRDTSWFTINRLCGSSIVWTEHGHCSLPLPASSRLAPQYLTEMDTYSLSRPQSILTESIAEGMSLCPMQEGGDQHLVYPRACQQFAMFMGARMM